MSQDKPKPIDLTDLTAGARGLAEHINQSEPLYEPRSDTVLTSASVNCSALRAPGAQATMQNDITDMVNGVAPLPSPAAGAPIAQIRELVDARIELRQSLEGYTNRTVQACGPKAPGS